ncbi:MAG TPA: RHS repeat-associated core domain-containing protein [Chloroflexota bacterium]|nr:RHS repeat-associated core domain-containing protein [Chloroflexota bacterium]
MLWQNPVDYHGPFQVGETFTANTGATTMRLALEVNLDAGYLAFNSFDLQHLTEGDVIRRSTYSVAGQAIAVKVTGDPDGNDGLFFLYSDHLGSANAMRHPNGSVTQTRYLPFGGYRGSSGGNPITDLGFTGHKMNDDVGLIYMNARYYSPYINRYISADTIVPNPTDPQSLNRFSYTRNNPLKFTDSSGHSYCDDMPEECQNSAPGLVAFDFEAGVEEIWHAGEIAAIYKGAFDLGSAFARDINARGRAMDLSQFGEDAYQDITPEEAFLSVMGGTVTFRKTGATCADRTDGEGCYAAYGGPRLVNVFTEIYDADGISKIPRLNTSHRWGVHELAHVLEARVNGILDVNYYVRNQLPNNLVNRNGFAGGFPGWQQSNFGGRGEIFADMVVGWTYREFETNPFTGALTKDACLKVQFMKTNMSVFIDIAR